MNNNQGLPTTDPTTDTPWWTSWYAGFSDFAGDTVDSLADAFDPDTNVIYKGVVHGANVVYEDVSSAVARVGKDLITGASTVTKEGLSLTDQALDIGTTKIVIIVAVLAVGLYYIGKTGAIKITL